MQCTVDCAEVVLTERVEAMKTAPERIVYLMTSTYHVKRWHCTAFMSFFLYGLFASSPLAFSSAIAIVFFICLKSFSSEVAAREWTLASPDV